MLSLGQRIGYFAWAASRHVMGSDVTCPSCGSENTALLRRKYLVTSLKSCGSCGLRFRYPKDREGQTEHFYQEEYSEGFTTDCPSDEALSGLVNRKFRNSEKDFTAYINVLRMLGLQPGAAVLDFGASWGYGSWQMREAGFRVYSYEVSKPRARYATVKLGCEMLESLDTLSGAVDCLFSAHVIEHLPSPNLLWELANRILSPDGLLVCFCPNGSPKLESVYGLHRYDKIWGKVHPLLITPDFLTGASGRHGFVCSVYSTPFAGVSSPPVRQSADGLAGAELLMVAQREFHV